MGLYGGGTAVAPEPTGILTHPRSSFPYFGRRYGSFSKVPEHHITLTAPPRIVQRGTTTGPLALSGTYSSPGADTVQVKVCLEADDSIVVDWTDVDVLLSSNVWSGSLSIPTGGPYVCQARLIDSSDNVLSASDSSHSLICGDVFVNLGQSNAKGFGTNNQTYSGSSVAWVVRQSGTIDETLNDPISDGGSGSWWPLLATLISAHTGSSVPIAVITQAEPTTALVASTAEWAYPTGAQWLLADALVESLDLNGIKAVLWLQGERDVTFSVAEGDYTEAEATLAAAINDWPGSPQLISTLTGQQTASATDSTISAIRQAKITNWNNGSTWYGANTIDFNLADGSGDGLHFKTDAELAELAGRIWLALKGAVYSGANGRGPRILAAMYLGTTVTITMDQPLASATSYTASAWIVKDDGVAVSVSSVAKSGGSQVVLTLASPPSGELTVTFGRGDDAIVADFPRALSVTLPATINGLSSVSIPAEPFVDYVVSLDTPEFMHGTMSIRPYIFGNIFARPYISGKVLTGPHIIGDIGLNP